jgi:hypothetical protein
VVFYGCENWSLKLRKEHKLGVFEKGMKRDEMVGGWKKLHNEELHYLYSSRGIIRMNKSRGMRW